LEETWNTLLNTLTFKVSQAHVTLGFGFTKTVTEADPEQPFLYPVTENVVLELGDTTIDEPDWPVFHI
jgi:hypothetical protein